MECLGHESVDEDVERFAVSAKVDLQMAATGDRWRFKQATLRAAAPLATPDKSEVRDLVQPVPPDDWQPFLTSGFIHFSRPFKWLHLG